MVPGTPKPTPADNDIAPTAKRARLVISAAAVAVAVANVLRWAIYVALGRTLNLFESGTVIVGGQRMLAGEMPYTDFFAFYGPLCYLLPGALAGVVGTVTTADFGYDLIVGTATAVVAYLLTVKLSGRPIWALLAPASIVLLGSNTSHTLAALLSILILCHAEMTGRRRWLIAGGFFGGVALLWVQDSGAWVCLAVFVTFLVGLRFPRVRALLNTRGFLLYAAGVLGGLGPWVLYAALRGAVGAWIYWSFFFPLTGYTARDATGYFDELVQSAIQSGGLRGLYIFVFWVFPFIMVFLLAAMNLGCAFKWACWPSATRGRSPVAPATFLVLALYAGFQLRVLLASVDEAKLIDVLTPTIVGSVVAALTLWPRTVVVPFRRFSMVAACIVTCWLLVWPAWAQFRSLLQLREGARPVAIQGLGGLPVAGAAPATVSPQQLGALVQELVGRSTAADSILVLPTSPLIYALSGRRNATRWEYLDPIYTTAEVDAAIAARVSERLPQVIVLGDNVFPGSDLTGPDLAPQTYLAISKNYTEQLTIGGFTLLVRR